MASIEDLKGRIDCADLAERLGLRRAAGRSEKFTMFHGPHGKGKNNTPSLSVFDGGLRWKDHAANAGGSCIDLVMHVEDCDAAGAIRRLHEIYAIPMEPPRSNEPRQEKTRAEYIADKVLAADPAPALEYLAGRGITDEVLTRARKARAVGFNDWRSPKVAEGQPMHGGPAAAFVVRSLNPGHVMAVDLRFIDPALNGGIKTQCQGEKTYPFVMEVKAFHAARTVVVVESSINALSVESAGLPKTAALACLGVGNVDNIDWRCCRGKQVLICLDHTDAPNDEGLRPGLAAAWRLHEALTRLDISALLVDQSEWGAGHDVNDFLQAHGAAELKKALRRLEMWMIPGQPGHVDEAGGRPRVFLPAHDWSRYGNYRVREDFTSVFTEKESRDEAGNVTVTPVYADLAGFRVAGISRVRIQGSTATTTGEEDTNPTVAFAVSVQTPRHGPELVRRVLDDEHLHSIDTWKKFGPVFNQSQFLRMVNILERTAHLGERTAANFVGLCYQDGDLRVSEGADCYFMDPRQQCPYYNLAFPSGSVADARRVIEAYQTTFRANAAMLALAWGLGAHLKVFLGFWPHMEMQAGKGHGKSTLAGRLERTLAMKVFSKETIKTAFRLITTTSATSHPVGWEEISANRQEVIDAAVSTLQEAYNFKPSPRGSAMLEFLTCAPVLLVGEDVPVRSLIGKLVRTNLTGKKGPQLPEDLPRFPVRQWLEFLAQQRRQDVRQRYEALREHCIQKSRASGADDGALRMAGNYAAVLLAWGYLCEFAGIDKQQGSFPVDLLIEMNTHIAETHTDREPWIWIMETVLAEIASNQFQYPYRWEDAGGETVLMLRTSHVMDHIRTSHRLREIWNGLPVKSDRVFRKQLQAAGAIFRDGVERSIQGRRVSHLVALSLSRLETYGLYATPPEEPMMAENDIGGSPPAPPQE